MMAEETRSAVWRGVAASLFLHLSIGAALLGAVSASRSTAVPVIDLTLTGSLVDPPAPAAEGHRASAPRHAGKAFPVPPKTLSPSDPAVPRTPSDAMAPEGSREPAKEEKFPAVPAEAAVSTALLRPSPYGTGAEGPPRPAGADSRSEPHGGGGTAAYGGPPGTTDLKYPFGNFTGIRDTIQRGIVYPPSARRQGMEGKVVVGFRLLPDGTVRNVRIIQSSGHYPLDQGAIEGVRNASPFPPPPTETEIITPVVYRLDPAP